MTVLSALLAPRTLARRALRRLGRILRERQAAVPGVLPKPLLELLKTRPQLPDLVKQRERLRLCPITTTPRDTLSILTPKLHAP